MTAPDYRHRLQVLAQALRTSADAWQRDPLVADDQADAVRSWANDLDALLAEPITEAYTPRDPWTRTP